MKYDYTSERTYKKIMRDKPLKKRLAEGDYFSGACFLLNKDESDFNEYVARAVKENDGFVFPYNPFVLIFFPMSYRGMI